MNNWSGIWDKVLKMAALAGGAIAGAMGGWDTLLIVLCYMMGIDYATGCICGMMGKSPKTDGGKLDSKTGWHGLGVRQAGKRRGGVHVRGVSGGG